MHHMSTKHHCLHAFLFGVVAWLCVLPLYAQKLNLPIEVPADFPTDAVIDITLAPYNAKPNDTLDDTDAIQQAITDHIGTGRFLYFPVGIYILSKPLYTRDKSGKFNARITFIGQSRQHTIFKLIDNAPDFADAANPHAILTTSSIQQQGDSPDGGGNKAFGNYILNMTFNTGRNNPGAIAISAAMSNWGAIQDVIIKSDDGQGIAGIAMTRRIPGPGLIRHVSIDGFDVGIDIADCQYGITMERVALTGQHTAGIRTNMNVLHINELQSQNQCPAVLATKPQSMVTVIHSNLTATASSEPAVVADNYLLLDVRSKGYHRSIKTPTGESFGSYTLMSTVGMKHEQINLRYDYLPVKNSPHFWEPDLTQWIAVGPRKQGENDDTQAIQRAIDSGKRVVYFVNDRQYFVSDTIIIRRNVRHLIAFGSEISLGAAREPFSNIANPRPVFRIDPTSHDQLLVEHLFFNCQYPGQVLFENNSPATLTIRHCGGWVGANGHRHAYRNTANATGTLFVEDVFLPGWNFTNQTVYARQFNPENPDGDGIEPQVLNDGGKLWILGFKTEGPAPFITTKNGGITELLGGYNYISATHQPTVPIDAVPYIIDNATASLTVITENFRDNDYKVYIRDNGRDVLHKDLPPRNGHKGDRSLAITHYQTTPATAE